MFKFLKNLFKYNHSKILDHVDKLDCFKNAETYKHNDFVFKFNDYGYVYEIKLEDDLCILEIFERSKEYSTSIFEYDNDWYNYISGSWDDELIKTINEIHNKILRDAAEKDYNNLSEKEKAKSHFNKKFEKVDE